MPKNDTPYCKHKNLRTIASPEPDLCTAERCVDCGLPMIRMHPYMPWNQEGNDEPSDSSENGKRLARQIAAAREAGLPVATPRPVVQPPVVPRTLF